MSDLIANIAKPQAEYKEAMQTLLREAGPRVFMAYYNKLMDEGAKVDDLRKGLELIINSTDAALERKVDANAHLPVFNITFDIKTGEMQAAQVAEEVKPETDVQDAVEVVKAIENDDAAAVDDMLRALDQALGL